MTFAYVPSGYPLTFGSCSCMSSQISSVNYNSGDGYTNTNFTPIFFIESYNTSSFKKLADLINDQGNLKSSKLFFCSSEIDTIISSNVTGTAVLQFTHSMMD